VQAEHQVVDLDLDMVERAVVFVEDIHLLPQEHLHSLSVALVAVELVDGLMAEHLHQVMLKVVEVVAQVLEKERLLFRPVILQPLLTF
jgi:hypothetical protein